MFTKTNLNPGGLYDIAGQVKKIYDVNVLFEMISEKRLVECDTLLWLI